MELTRPAREAELARPGPRRSHARHWWRGDRVWSAALTALGGVVLLLAGVIVLELWRISRPAWHAIGIGSFVTGSDWNPVESSFGAWPFIYGTLVTSAVALLLAFPVGVGVALFVSELAPRRLRRAIAFPIEILAAVPSVVYGLWGLFVLVPWLRERLEPWLGHTLGFVPLFQGPPLGVGYLAGGVVLAIMILPTISAVAIEVIATVPLLLREGAFALGATTWEMVAMVVLPSSRIGLLGAALLGLGRALGETMAVTMVIGNTPEVHASLFAPGYSLPAVIANEFAESTSSVHTAALAALGLILFGLSFILNAGARALVQSAGRVHSHRK